MTPPAAIDAGMAAPAVPREAHASWRMFAGAVAAIVLLAAYPLYFVLPARYVAATDDATVQAHVIAVATKVAGYLVAMPFDDNAQVRSGDLVARIDPRDFTVAVDAAEADLQSAQATLANVAAQIAEQQSVIAQAEAALAGDRSNLAFAQQQLARYQSLAGSGYGTTQRLEQAQSDIGQWQASLRRDTAAGEAAKAHVAVLAAQQQSAEAAIARAQAMLARAKLDLSYTEIRAGVAGSIADKKAEVGDYLPAGTRLFSLVPNDLFVVANYKEEQLAGVRPGQPVRISIDAFPEVTLHGHVDSIQRGTGAQFALLPPENATGNFVKVVQRVPVKIVLDDAPDMMRWIAPGMSVETRIVIQEPPTWLRFLK
jgi:membrane fusion protein (multidrug efflux system)